MSHSVGLLILIIISVVNCCAFTFSCTQHGGQQLHFSFILMLLLSKRFFLRDLFICQHNPIHETHKPTRKLIEQVHFLTLHDGNVPNLMLCWACKPKNTSNLKLNSSAAVVCLMDAAMGCVERNTWRQVSTWTRWTCCLFTMQVPEMSLRTSQNNKRL